MEEDWSSANHFGNFPRQKKVFCVWSEMQICVLLCGADIFFLRYYRDYLILKEEENQIFPFNYVTFLQFILVKCCSKNQFWWFVLFVCLFVFVYLFVFCLKCEKEHQILPKYKVQVQYFLLKQILWSGNHPHPYLSTSTNFWNNPTLWKVLCTPFCLKRAQRMSSKFLKTIRAKKERFGVAREKNRQTVCYLWMSDLM